jgi:hypothetical protein
MKDEIKDFVKENNDEEFKEMLEKIKIKKKKEKWNKRNKNNNRIKIMFYIIYL